MQYSYWELKEWFNNVDFTIVGSGIVGINCALELQSKHPKAKIIILEKGILPQGASSKNAGFACFGSLSELVSDLKTHTEEDVFNLVKKRWEGLQMLRNKIGDAALCFQQHKGFELFNDKTSFEAYFAEKEKINQLLHPLFKKDVFTVDENLYAFNNIYPKYITNQFEGQLDTGKMMTELLQKAHLAGIKILNGINVSQIDDHGNKVFIKTNQHEFSTRQLLIATNGFAKQFIKDNIEPARAQVVITNPIKNLHIKGTFHLEEGFYYFRNIDNRILLGGGRNLDFKGENTCNFGQSEKIQNKLEEILKTIILPQQSFKIAHRWSGIMGVGNQKKAIVKQLSNNVYCGVRLGGMGVAIGSLVGKELADLVCD